MLKKEELVMKTSRIVTAITSLSLCFMTMVAPSFASEVPVNNIVNESVTIEPRAGATVSGTTSAATIVYALGNNFNVTCVFNITYNNLSGYVYSASIASIYDNVGHSIKGRIISTSRYGNDYVMNIALDFYNGSRYLGSGSGSFRI